MPRTAPRIAVAALVAGLALAGVVPETSAQTAVPSLRAVVNQRIGGEAPLLRTAQASGLAVNPADPKHIVESETNPRYGLCQHNVTFDGGATWTTGVIKAPAKFGPRPCEGFNQVNRLRMDGGIAFGSGQNVYIAFDARPPGDTEGSTTLVARSTDGGRTFGEAQIVMAGTAGVDAGFGDDAGQQTAFVRPKLGVHRRAGGDRVIVASNFIGYLKRTAAVAVSNDGAATWGPVVEAQPPDGTAQYISNPAVGPDGTIYLSWRTQNSTGLGFPANADEFGYFAKSSDGGLTWEASVQRKLSPRSKSSRVNERRLAVDAQTGAVYQVDNETVTNFPGQTNANVLNADIWVVRTTDKGATWSAPKKVNDDPTPNQQSVPNISVAPNGRVDVVWSDRRHAYEQGTKYHDIYMASSSDGGVTFSANRRLTDRSLSLTNGLTTVRSTDFFVPGIAPLGDSEVMVSWPDERLTDFETENMDIFFTKVQVNPTGPPPSTSLPLGQPSGLSASLSRLAYPGGSEKHVAGGPVGTTVVVVNDADPAAAVSASVLARANLAPVLAAPAFGLPADVEAEVKRLKPAGAYLVGSEEKLSSAVVGDLIAAGVPADKIFRLAGSDAADTARIVADTYMKIEKAASRLVNTTAVIVDPTSKEAGAAAGLAAALRHPVLFVNKGSVPAATVTAIAALGVTSTLVIGSPDIVTDGVLGALPGALRVAGHELYGTAAAAAAYASSKGVPTNIAYIADGDRPIDAGILAAAVARLGGTLVLAPFGDPSKAVLNNPDRVVVARSIDAGALGYRLVASDGGVFAYGGARFLGSTASLTLAQPIVGTASTLGGGGYWLVASDGGVFSFGDAQFYGSTGALKLNKPVVGMAPTPTGQGYYLVASDGGVFNFGDAGFHGSTGAMKLNQPIVGMAVTPTGKGYHLVAADGGIFAFGDAEFYGSTGALKLNKPVIGMTATPKGRGYLLAAADGGMFAFGDAVFRGSTGALKLNAPMVAMSATPAGDGYWLIASDGGVFAFGAAPFYGSAGSVPLNKPVVAGGR